MYVFLIVFCVASYYYRITLLKYIFVLASWCLRLYMEYAPKPKKKISYNESHLLSSNKRVCGLIYTGNKTHELIIDDYQHPYSIQSLQSVDENMLSTNKNKLLYCCIDNMDSNDNSNESIDVTEHFRRFCLYFSPGFGMVDFRTFFEYVACVEDNPCIFNDTSEFFIIMNDNNFSEKRYKVNDICDRTLMYVFR